MKAKLFLDALHHSLPPALETAQGRLILSSSLQGPVGAPEALSLKAGHLTMLILARSGQFRHRTLPGGEWHEAASRQKVRAALQVFFTQASAAYEAERGAFLNELQPAVE